MCVIEDRECYLTVHHIVFVDILLSYNSLILEYDYVLCEIFS